MTGLLALHINMNYDKIIVDTRPELLNYWLYAVLFQVLNAINDTPG